MNEKKWNAEEEYRIVMESLATSAETSEICRKYGLSPNTFYSWREKFLDAGKTVMAGKTNRAAIRVLQKENDHLKTLLAESTLVVDTLKKSLGWEESMMAVQCMVEQGLSLNKALGICEVSKQQ